MEKYLFIVRNQFDGQLAASEMDSPIRIMQTAHELIDAFSSYGAQCCEIWLRTDFHKMTLLGTAF